MAKTFHWPGEKKSRKHSRPYAGGKGVSKPKPVLTPEQKRKQRMAQVVVPGGTLTRGGLRGQVRAAARTRFGPVEAAEGRELTHAQNYQRDIAGYYDDYLQRIARQTANVRTLGDQANAAIAGLQQGVTGLSAASQQQMQAQANTDAAARGATAGDLAPMASNAAAVRQALVGSFGAQQAAASDAASRYADTQETVGAQQKLQAVAGAAGRVREVREKQSDTARQKGAFKAQTRGELISEEGKNVLAAKVANVDLAKANAQIASTKASTRKTRTDTRKTKAELDFFKKHGYYPKTGPTSASEKKTKAELDFFRKHGYWPPTGPPKKNNGSDSSTTKNTESVNAGLGQLNNLKKYALLAKQGKPFVPGHDKGPKAGKFAPMNKQAALDKLLKNSPSIKNPWLAHATIEILYDGKLSSATRKGLRAGGYTPQEVVRLLADMRASINRPGHAPGAKGQSRPT